MEGILLGMLDAQCSRFNARGGDKQATGSASPSRTRDSALGAQNLRALDAVTGEEQEAFMDVIGFSRGTHICCVIHNKPSASNLERWNN
jgi:hypothetical protein